MIGNTPSVGTNWRFCQAMAGIPWESKPPEEVYNIKLRYAGIPGNGRKVRRDVEALFRRLDRVFGLRDEGAIR